MTTYSFKDTSGAFSSPTAGAFLFAGQIGLHQATVEMTTEKTIQDVASDGNVMVSAIAGDNGHIALEMQQTCELHAFLLQWYNTIKVLMLAGDVTNWATAAITLRNLVDGTSHVLTGVSPSKIPTKTYTAQGQHVTWTLMAADIQTVTL